MQTLVINVLAVSLPRMRCRKPLVSLERPGVAAREHEQVEVLVLSPDRVGQDAQTVSAGDGVRARGDRLDA